MNTALPPHPPTPSLPADAPQGEWQPAPVYVIRVQGALDDLWAVQLSRVTIERHLDAQGRPVTTLKGALPDQSALAGILDLLLNLNLTLLSVDRIEPGARAAG